MGRKSEDNKRRRRKDKARDKAQRRGKNTLRGARFKLRMLEKTTRAKTGKKMNKNGGAGVGAAGMSLSRIIAWQISESQVNIYHYYLG